MVVNEIKMTVSLFVTSMAGWVVVFNVVRIMALLVAVADMKMIRSYMVVQVVKMSGS